MAVRYEGDMQLLLFPVLLPLIRSRIFLLYLILPCQSRAHCQNSVELTCFSASFLHKVINCRLVSVWILSMLKHQRQNHCTCIFFHFPSICNVWEVSSFPEFGLYILQSFFQSSNTWSRVLWNISCTCKIMLTANLEETKTKWFSGDQRVSRAKLWKIQGFLISLRLLNPRPVLHQIIQSAGVSCNFSRQWQMLPDPLSPLSENPGSGLSCNE